jgi:predicted RNA binding protein YcfA (HicA-like mRNA interferase family)
MSPKRNVESPKDLIKRLELEGWTRRPGKGDHVIYRKAGHSNVAIDTGAREVPIGTLRSIYKAAKWDW